MPMSDDPNPRVHRVTRVCAVNVAECAMIDRVRWDGDQLTRVHLKTGMMRAGDLVMTYVDIMCSDDEHMALLDAFERWGSCR